MNHFLRRLTMRQRLSGSTLTLCALILAMAGWSAIRFHALQQHVGEIVASTQRVNPQAGQAADVFNPVRLG